MSQQELAPEPQEGSKETYRKSYNWSVRRGGSAPKDEHPTTFEESYSYTAQDQSENEQQVPRWARPQQHKRNRIWLWIVLILLGVALVKVAAVLLAILGTVLIIAIAIIAFIILVILGILAALAILAFIIFSMWGISFHRNSPYIRSDRRWRKS